MKESKSSPIAIIDLNNGGVKKVVRYDEDLGHQVIVEELDEEREKLDHDIN